MRTSSRSPERPHTASAPLHPHPLPNHQPLQPTIQNHSSRAVTAFAILFVPSGVPNKSGSYDCRGRCAATPQIADSLKPVIPPGGTASIKAEISALKAGAVIAEAAIFDDATYKGRERFASYLVAEQLGNQTEFARIVTAVNNFFSTPIPETEASTKYERLRAQLTALPVDSAPATITAFDRRCRRSGGIRRVFAGHCFFRWRRCVR